MEGLGAGRQGRSFRSPLPRDRVEAGLEAGRPERRGCADQEMEPEVRRDLLVAG